MPKEERLFSVFERWPDGLFYAPVALYWAWLALKFHSLTLPTIADPGIENGGFIGESKIDAFEVLGPLGRAAIAPYGFFTVRGEGDLAEAKQTMQKVGLSYPIVAKPDFGKNGTGVRIIRDEAALAEYLASFPKGARVILQKYADLPGEAGVFYIRRPSEATGRVTSITLKYFPAVVGDGVSTLRELILKDPRAKMIAQLYFRRNAARLEEVIPNGTSFTLLSVGNHCKGAIFKNGNAYTTPALTAAIDRISKDIPEYYFGRYDVRYASLEALERGEFVIIEYNGAGSEMTHIWDANETLRGAYRTLFYQYRTAFEIGAENRRRGYRPISVMEFVRAWYRERALLLDSTHEE